jgi:hypothetical protein
MNRTAGIFVIGLVIGAAVTALILVELSEGEKGEAQEQEIASLRTRVQQLEREKASLPSIREEDASIRASVVDDMDDMLEAPPPIEDIPRISEDEPIQDPTIVDSRIEGLSKEQQIKAELEKFGGQLQSLIMGNGDAAKKAIQRALEIGGPGTAMEIFEQFEKNGNIGLAHAVAQTNDPEAMDKLKAVVLDHDRGFIERRTAVHGLAFSDAEGLESFYEEVATSDPDLGTRANAAYGLARRNDAGIELYAKSVDQAFKQKDSAALQYLSGLVLLGKRALPTVHERLRTITDKQARLTMILHVIGEHKDPDSIPVLRELAGNPETDADVRKAAEATAEKIAKGD